MKSMTTKHVALVAVGAGLAAVSLNKVQADTAVLPAYEPMSPEAVRFCQFLKVAGIVGALVLYSGGK